MQVTEPSTGQLVVFVWFAVSVIVAVVGTVALWIWLRRQGVQLVYGLAGIPGYMEHAYIAWCRSQRVKPNKTVILLRAISIVNVVLAAVVAIPLLAGP